MVLVDAQLAAIQIVSYTPWPVHVSASSLQQHLFHLEQVWALLMFTLHSAAAHENVSWVQG